MYILLEYSRNSPSLWAIFDSSNSIRTQYVLLGGRIRLVLANEEYKNLDLREIVYSRGVSAQQDYPLGEFSLYWVENLVSVKKSNQTVNTSPTNKSIDLYAFFKIANPIQSDCISLVQWIQSCRSWRIKSFKRPFTTNQFKWPKTLMQCENDKARLECDLSWDSGIPDKN